MPLKTAAAEKAAVTFNPAEFAEMFWTNQLLPSLAKAVKAEAAYCLTIRADAAAGKSRIFAERRHERELFLLFVRYRTSHRDIGRRSFPGDNRRQGTNAEVVTRKPASFSATRLRDGTGLLNVNDYPNSQEFNGISEALNHIVETRVLPTIARAGESWRADISL